MALVNVINQLKSFEKGERKKVLTIYLNTDRSECQKSSWKIRLKNGLKKLNSYIQLSGTEEELKKFNKLKDKVEKTIFDSVTSLQKSVVIFASNDDKLYSVHFMQVPVENEFFWEDTPELTQLTQIQGKFPSSGVLLANDDEITLMHSSLGEIEVINHFSFEADTDDWREYDGLSATERISSSANHRDKFQERYYANQQRWIRSILPLIEKEAQTYDWKHIHIVGQAEYVQYIETELKVPIKNVVRKTLPSKDQNEIIFKQVLAV